MRLLYSLRPPMTPDAPVAMPIREGEILGGKYRVERVLGAGGMGVVVAATHLQLGQRVAIKFLLPDALKNERALERFTREARAAAQLTSTNVARVVDVGALESGAPYMVMEFLDGLDLGQLVETRGPLSLEDAVDYVLQACEAVAEAHALGIVHRDLKPRNIFLTHRPSGAPLVKVLDFGISKVTEKETIGGMPAHALTRSGDLVGSPTYMAPEQMQAQRGVDGRTDVWALGGILFELLTARTPFLAETLPELCAMVLLKPHTPLAELRPDLPAALGDVINRCLEKEPEDRFASVNELSMALAPFSPHSQGALLARSSPNSRPALTGGAGSGSRQPSARVVVSGGTSVSWGATELAPMPNPRKSLPFITAGVLAAIAIVAAIAVGRSFGATHATPSAPASLAVEQPTAAPSGEATTAITAAPSSAAPSPTTSSAPIDAGATARPPPAATAAAARTAATSTPTATAIATATATPADTDYLPSERK